MRYDSYNSKYYDNWLHGWWYVYPKWYDKFGCYVFTHIFNRCPEKSELIWGGL